MRISFKTHIVTSSWLCFGFASSCLFGTTRPLDILLRNNGTIIQQINSHKSVTLCRQQVLWSIVFPPPPVMNRKRTRQYCNNHSSALIIFRAADNNVIDQSGKWDVCQSHKNQWKSHSTPSPIIFYDYCPNLSGSIQNQNAQKRGAIRKITGRTRNQFPPFFKNQKFPLNGQQ